MKKVGLLLLGIGLLGLSACQTPAQSGETPSSSSGQTDVTLKMYVPYDIVDLTKQQVARFKETFAWTNKLDIEVEPAPSGDAGLPDSDPLEGIDLYFFVQDQLSRLHKAGDLEKVRDEFVSDIKGNNTQSSVEAASVGETLYAYPASADNGSILYYDASVFGSEDVADWDNFLAKAQTEDRSIAYDYGSAWNNFGFFYAVGCDSVWETNEDGKFVSFQDNFDSPQGLEALKTLTKLIKSPAIEKPLSLAKASEKCAAIVSGTWDYQAAVKRWGSNLKCAELPCFVTSNGTKVHTGSFSGNHLIGVKPTDDPAKSYAAHHLANYLSGKPCQSERLEALAWAPCNKELIASEALSSKPQIAALTVQNQYAKPQGLFPGAWWDAAGTVFANTIGNAESVDDAFLQSVLDTYQRSLPELLNA